jgi:hypothetical protein
MLLRFAISSAEYPACEGLKNTICWKFDDVELLWLLVSVTGTYAVTLLPPPPPPDDPSEFDVIAFAVSVAIWLTCPTTPPFVYFI